MNIKLLKIKNINYICIVNLLYNINKYILYLNKIKNSLYDYNINYFKFKLNYFYYYYLIKFLNFNKFYYILYKYNILYKFIDLYLIYKFILNNNKLLILEPYKLKLIFYNNNILYNNKYYNIKENFNYKILFFNNYNYKLNNNFFLFNHIYIYKICNYITLNYINLYFCYKLVNIYYNKYNLNILKKTQIIYKSIINKNLKNSWKYYIINNNLLKFNLFNNINKTYNNLNIKLKINDIIFNVNKIENLLENTNILYKNNLIYIFNIFILNINQLYFDKINNLIYIKFKNFNLLLNNLNIIKCINLNYFNNILNINELLNNTQQIQITKLNIQYIIDSIFYNNIYYMSMKKATFYSFIFSYMLLVESLFYIYNINYINTPLIHFELFIRKMLSFVQILNSYNNIFIGDIIDYKLVLLINFSYKINNLKLLKYKPIVLGLTKLSMASSGLLTQISFQKILKQIVKNALNITYDWLVDIKSNILINFLLPSNLGWLEHFR